MGWTRPDWLPDRPLRQRIRLAWLVLIGRADAIAWSKPLARLPDAEEREAAAARATQELIDREKIRRNGEP
jgi:hypothetical protein